MKVLEKGLNSYQIKIIAVICMTLDHILGKGLIQNRYWFTEIFAIVGRIAAPLFLFMVVQGLKHTRNKFFYTLRLYVAAAIVQILNTIVHDTFYPNSFEFGNVLYTLFYVALFVILIENYLKVVHSKNKVKILLSLLLLALPFITVIVEMKLLNSVAPIIIYKVVLIFMPSVMNVMYSFLFIILGVYWYYSDKKTKNCIIYIAFCLLCFFLEGKIFNSVYHSFIHLLVPPQRYMILALPFIALYNG